MQFSGINFGFAVTQTHSFGAGLIGEQNCAMFTELETNHHYLLLLLSLNHEGLWGTIDDFATSLLHFLLFSTALWGLANYRSVHSLMLSSHLFLCLPCLLPPFTVSCKVVLAKPDERET